jgi:hypothetical protein
MNRMVVLLSLSLIAPACQRADLGFADDAIRRIEDCVCYKSAEGQQLEPWQLTWNDPDKLRQEVSHCVCKVHIDLKSVKDPSRYVVPGTELR